MHIKDLFKRTKIFALKIFLSGNEPQVKKTVKQDILVRFSLFFLIMLVFAIAIIVKTILITTIEVPKYRLPIDIKDDLKRAIILDCDYDDLKSIFDNKPRVNIRNKIFLNNTDFYDVSVDLARVLDDMIFDYYLKSQEDSLYILKLKIFIKETKEKHPFDKLDEAQKELFIALRDNAGAHYYLIENNLLSISNELNNKNETIEVYLDKAYQSYIVSIIALLISIITLLIPQIPHIRKKIEERLTKEKK